MHRNVLRVFVRDFPVRSAAIQAVFIMNHSRLRIARIGKFENGLRRYTIIMEGCPLGFLARLVEFAQNKPIALPIIGRALYRSLAGLVELRPRREFIIFLDGGSKSSILSVKLSTDRFILLV